MMRRPSSAAPTRALFGRAVLGRTFLGLGLLALVAGCRATSVAYRFTPSPLEAIVQDGSGGPVVARVLVGVPGAEREGRRTDGYPLLVVRVRVENKADEELVFDPARAVLVGPDLAEFGRARATPDGPLRVAPGAAEGALLRFPFPRDTRDLDAPLLTGVNLQFELERPSRTLELSVTLERNEPEVIYDPGPAFTFGPGYYYYGRW